VLQVGKKIQVGTLKARSFGSSSQLQGRLQRFQPCCLSKTGLLYLIVHYSLSVIVYYSLSAIVHYSLITHYLLLSVTPYLLLSISPYLLLSITPYLLLYITPYLLLSVIDLSLPVDCSGCAQMFQSDVSEIVSVVGGVSNLLGSVPGQLNAFVIVGLHSFSLSSDWS